MAFKGEIIVDAAKCKGCLVCMVNCPQNCIQVSDNVNAKGHKYVEQVGDNCIGCANCAVVCPDAVISVYRAKG
ncbi:MAG: 4Fe-4S dicluster domain-containing protein [Bacteroidales bacterium]|jgi:2-oxoglutarate ferredoxin oxidoreductase subunit delta|nr:4Fe-4S dicluster domain-containing protein [Bacteroidales bacterium]